MENIAEKIKVLDYSDETMATLPKFLGTLVAKDPTTGEDLVTVEEERQIVDYLKEKGISLRPTHLKVLAKGFSYIQKAVEEMDKIGELKMYVDDPSRMIAQDNVNRILYLRNNGIEYKSPEGKYSKLAYNRREFEAKFGVIDLDAERAKKQKSAEVKAPKAPEEQPKAPKEEPVVKVPVQNTPLAPVLEEAKDDKIVINNENKTRDIRPVTPINPRLEPEKKETIKPIGKDETSEYTGALDLASIEASFNSPSTKPEEVVGSSNDVNQYGEFNGEFINYEEILRGPQMAALNDQTFGRFENLLESVRRVLTTVYNITEVNDIITNNLIKLIAAGVPSDSDVIYYAITHGKNVTEEEAQQLRNSIEEELEYIKIFDLDTDNQGRAKAA